MAYSGHIEPDGWIFCDGIERENIDGIFDKLIFIKIGKLNDMKYAPPLYENMDLIKKDKIDVNKLMPKFYGHVHNTRLKLDQLYFKREDTIVEKNPIIKEWITNTINNTLSNNNIIELKWIIKY